MSCGERKFKRNRLPVIKVSNLFVANVEHSTYEFKLRVDCSGQIFSHSLKGPSNDSGSIKMLDAAGMRRINNVRPFVGLIFNRNCGSEDAASVTKVFVSYTNLLLVFCNRHGVGLYYERIELIQNAIKISKNFTRESFQNFHSIRILKWHLLDHSVEDVRQSRELAYAAVDRLGSGYKQYKKCFEGSSKRIGGA